MNRIKHANILYLIVMLLLVLVGSYVQGKDFNTGILITEFVLVAMPALLYFLIKKQNLKQKLRINKISIAQIVLVISIFVSGYFVAVFLNMIGTIILSLFGKVVPPPIPVPQNQTEYLVLILIVAGSAGICEELLFRGIMLREYEEIGVKKSLIITSILFGMIHLNIQNFIGPAFLGFLLGYVVIKTDSIFAGMIGHFINNSISVSLQYLIYNLPFYKDMSIEQEALKVDTLALINALFPLGVLALVSGLIMVFCMKSLNGISSKARIENTESTVYYKDIIKHIKSSWPIYISFFIFMFFTYLQISKMMKG